MKCVQANVRRNAYYLTTGMSMAAVGDRSLLSELRRKSTKPSSALSIDDHQVLFWVRCGASRVSSSREDIKV